MKDNYPEYIEKIFEFIIPSGQKPERLDVYLSNAIKNASRTKVQDAIEEGFVSINGKQVKPSHKIQPNDIIICKIYKPPPIELIPEDIPLDIIYEDEYLIVVNKPPGMVCHPGHGNRYGTLVNALLFHSGQRNPITIEYDEDEDENLNEGIIFSSNEIRPGVVHRLDKDTSGLLLCSKNPFIHSKLTEQFSNRTVEKEYLALVWGVIKEANGTFTGDIGRSLRDRKLFAVVKKGGKPAITDFTILKRFEFATLVKIHLRTGRTHQIRVHFSHNHHPVFGDPGYGGNSVVYGGNTSRFKSFVEKQLTTINRQMLHAQILGFKHPITNEMLRFEAKIPEDMDRIIKEFDKF